LPDRTIGGRRWTAWHNGDAGMSQQIDATDLRTVWRDRCYAVARISYAVKAMETPPGLPAQAQAAAAMDRALASLRLR
jgi:chitinase